MGASQERRQEANNDTGGQKVEDQSVIVFTGFVGSQGSRVINKADWKAIGVEDQDTVTFDRSNNFRMPASKLTGPALDYLLDVDGEFKKVNPKTD